FDLIYSCQDVEVDRRGGARSFPARVGGPAALRPSTVVDVAAVGAFAWFGAAARRGWVWWGGMGVTAAVVYSQTGHRAADGIVRANDLSRVNRAFFTANGVIGIGLFVFALADLVVQGLGA